MASLFDDYTQISGKTFEQAVQAVRTRAEANGFTVLGVHNLHDIFGAKGFQHAPVAVVEMCNEAFGSWMLGIDPQMSLMMPCKIAVYVKDGRAHISALRPRLLADFMPEFASMVEQGDAAMCRIVDESC